MSKASGHWPGRCEAGPGYCPGSRGRGGNGGRCCASGGGGSAGPRARAAETMVRAAGRPGGRRWPSGATTCWGGGRQAATTSVGRASGGRAASGPGLARRGAGANRAARAEAGCPWAGHPSLLHSTSVAAATDFWVLNYALVRKVRLFRNANGGNRAPCEVERERRWRGAVPCAGVKQ